MREDLKFYLIYHRYIKYELEILIIKIHRYFIVKSSKNVKYVVFVINGAYLLEAVDEDKLICYDPERF